MKKALIGASGHAREVISQIGIQLPMFVDDEYLTENTKPISKLDYNKYEIMVAVADPVSREEIIARLPKNVKFFTYIHPSVLLLDDNIEIGEGSFIGAYSILTTNIKIGKHCILNRMNQIGHDSIVGDYLSMMPGSIISGNCTIGNCFYMGSNSSIKEKLNISDNVTLGLNSGIVKDINKQGIYGGIPAKFIK
jgi:sugar O-acyltransferase (sialic acid O-acetyltransferase NeuD family)